MSRTTSSPPVVVMVSTRESLQPMTWAPRDMEREREKNERPGVLFELVRYIGTVHWYGTLVRYNETIRSRH